MRKLPWLNEGAATKTQVKAASKSTKRARTNVDEEDDSFFDGTVLASSSKSKERVDLLKSGDEDELPELPGKAVRRGTNKVTRFDRAPSSSPPPSVLDIPPPKFEYMLEAVDKFDLRDDEWMMVEDEFLQTAKLFTRHLHLAEYARLKESIEAKKVVARPTVPNVQPSKEHQLHLKAQALGKTQRRALKDTISPSDKLDEDTASVSKRLKSSKTENSTSSGPHRPEPVIQKTTSTRPPPKKQVSFDASDSDDLDSHRKRSQPPQNKPKSKSTTFAKPSLPQPPKPPTSRPTRSSPFDLLDQATPERSLSTSKTSHQRASSTTDAKPAQSRSFPVSSQPSNHRPSTSQAGRSFDLFSELDAFPSREVLPKEQTEQTERIAKRKAERGKEKEKEVKKVVKLDDIPTWL